MLGVLWSTGLPPCGATRANAALLGLRTGDGEPRRGNLFEPPTTSHGQRACAIDITAPLHSPQWQAKARWL